MLLMALFLLCCFNGAVDEHRRSRSLRGRLPRGTTRFNGAVDEHRRSPTQPAGGSEEETDASMGPSMSIDGVRKGKVTVADAKATLQWGRR